jgi:hypothetical protein
MSLPTYTVRNAQHGIWYVDVEQFSPRIPVLHHMLLGPGSIPWPPAMQFLNGDLYDQPCFSNWIEKKAQIARMIHLKGLVVMTIDLWERPPATPGVSGRYRIDYVGVFRASGMRFDSDHHQRFKLDKQLCHLRKPGQHW